MLCLLWPIFIIAIYSYLDYLIRSLLFSLATMDLKTQGLTFPLTFWFYKASSLNLIYKSNRSEENDKDGKEPIDIELTVQKADPENDENEIEFRLSSVHGEDEQDIVKANYIESIQKQTDEENFTKR